MVHAQGEGAIHGVVMAEADRSSIPNTGVWLEGPTLPEPLQTTTGDDGHFGFQRLVPGQYSLVVAHAGFLEERTHFWLKPREVKNLTLQLALRPLAETVEVTTESVAVAGTHSPSSTVLHEQRIGNLPLGQRTNLPEIIVATAPGMIRSHDDFVHVRGSELALNVFINGVSFWENPHSVFSPGLSPDLIQSVNVMTGGFPAEYGNRFGGVLDVVTKSGFSMDNEGALTVGAGTALRHNLGVQYGGHTQKAAYFLFSSAFESARFLSPPGPRAIHDTGRGMRNFLQLDFNVNPTNFLKLVLMGDGTNFQIPKTALDDELRPDFNAFQRTRSQTAIFTWSRILSNDALLNTSFYQRWSRSLLLPSAEPLAATARSERTLHTTGIKSDLTRFFGRHTLKGGLDLVLLRPQEKLFYDYEGFRQFTHLLDAPHVHFDGPISFDQQKTGGQISLYLQDKVQLTDRLTVDAGLRYDRYTLASSHFHFSPRLNLAYRFLRTGTVLHGSYNHFFVPPAIENVLASSAGLSQRIREIGVALPPLRPVIENQFELGVTQPFHDNFRLGLTGYYRLSNDQLHTVLLPDSRVYNYANFDKAKAWGMEVKMDVPTLARVGLGGYLNYALSRVYLYNPVVAGFLEDSHHLEDDAAFLAPMDQTHTLTAGFTYRHPGSGLWLSMAFEYGSGVPSHGEGGRGDEEPMGEHGQEEAAMEHADEAITAASACSSPRGCFNCHGRHAQGTEAGPGLPGNSAKQVRRQVASIGFGAGIDNDANRLGRSTRPGPNDET
ncbi:MAG: TonB-dependent receptor [Acidobacteria bacterium]|nr:TonB-dependent receptor [Acidobacteriota bacterium]